MTPILMWHLWLARLACFFGDHEHNHVLTGFFLACTRPGGCGRAWNFTLRGWEEIQ